MKQTAIIILLSLTACDPGSSPEGRSKLRDEQINTQVDILKQQQQALLDSIASIRRELNVLKK